MHTILLTFWNLLLERKYKSYSCHNKVSEIRVRPYTSACKCCPSICYTIYDYKTEIVFHLHIQRKNIPGQELNKAAKSRTGCNFRRICNGHPLKFFFIIFCFFLIFSVLLTILLKHKNIYMYICR